MNLVRSGSYSRLLFVPDARADRTYIWNSYSVSNAYAKSLWAYREVLSSTDTVAKHAGYAVRFASFANPSFTEAMGWPRDT